MKILYVQTIRLDEHTCKTSRLEMIERLAAFGADVTFVAGYGRRAGLPSPTYRLVLVPFAPVPVLGHLLFNLRVQARVLGLLARERFDHVILDPYTFHCAFPLDLAARLGLCRTRVVLDVRSGIFHRRVRPVSDRLGRALIRVALAYARRVFSGFTTISPMLRERLAREHGIPPGRIGIWQSGVSLGRFDPSRVSAGRGAGLAGKFVVMHHGTLGLDRGLPETVEAMRLLRPSYPDIVLYLLGDGSEEGRLRTLVRTHGLDNVRFAPTVDHEQVPVHIQGCDVGILPLLPTPVMRSSSPLKLLEYLAMEKPVIVSRIEAFTEVLAGYPGAVFLDAVTPEAIARAIETAYRERRALSRAAVGGRRLVKERFTWERQAEEFWRFLAGGSQE
ncbi:MAG: hypothetical protein A3K12_13560 [Candidatus Rokubacteria bacterium RIFCSPLOWO2_12_FULL_71_19]|nr:MAG: hypothetical protein A3K12_13560 [Candidatus Rokubacteria bacterium RIFCSPLOWO2_12_FULL_71_19]